MSNDHDNPFFQDPAGVGPTATLPHQPPPPASTGNPNTGRRANGGPNTGRRAATVVLVTVLAVVGTTLLAIAMLVALAIGAVIGVAIDADIEDITHRPTTVDDIPTSIVADQAEVVIDLTALSADDFDVRSDPLSVDVDIEVGSVEVIVPDDLSVAVDADSDLGSTTVFDRTDDGLDNRLVVDGGPAADIDLTIDVDLGDIDVDRR